MNTELWDMLCEDEEVLSFDFENVTLCNEIGGDGAFFFKVLAFGLDNFITLCCSTSKLHGQ